MTLAERLELASAERVLSMARRYIRYLNKEGEFAGPKWWNLGCSPREPMPVSPDMVRHAEQAIANIRANEIAAAGRAALSRATQGAEHG